MSRSRRVAAIAATVLVVCLTGSVLLLARIDRMRPTATLDQTLYLSSPKLLKRLSLGYYGLLADVYWTRAVQYYGSMHRAGGGRYELLWPLLNITTQLDPHLIKAYEFGGSFLSAKPPMGAGLPDKAAELIEYGIRENPDNWRLYYDLGFIRYDWKDYRGAADAFMRGSKLPDAHPVLAILAARMAEHGGELETARLLWKTTYQTSNDPDIRGNALTHLKALQADDDVIELDELAETYKGRFGRYPMNFREMVAAGILRGLPVDPAGHPYRLEPSGKVMVSNPEDLPFLTQGLPPGYVPSEIIKGPTDK